MKRNVVIAGSFAVAALLAFVVYSETSGPRYVGGPVAIVGTPPQHGMLGVTLGDTQHQLTLTEVLRGAPGYQAGFIVGDTILSINDAEVESADEFLTVIRSTRPDDIVMIRVLRNGTELELTPELCDFHAIAGFQLAPVSIPQSQTSGEP